MEPKSLPSWPWLHSCTVCQKIVVDLRRPTPTTVIGDLQDLVREHSSGVCIFVDQILANCKYSEGLSYLLQQRQRLASLHLNCSKNPRHAWIRSFWHDSNPWQYLVYALDDDPAAKYIDQRPPNLDVASPQSFQLARKWIRNCFYGHFLCPGPCLLQLPSRVIDVSVDPPKLYIPGRHAQGRYAALSYCWGGPQPVTCTKESLENFTNSIPCDGLPQTIKDGIQVTKRLGLRYLWVDSLCIVQDDEEDKIREIPRMSQIYSSAYVTISAATAATCRDGFLKPRPRTWTDIQLQAICPNGKLGSIILTTGGNEISPDSEPIHSRAWTMQENILSPRLLIYGARQMEWCCLDGVKFDGGNYDNSRAESRNLPVFTQALLAARYGVTEHTASLRDKIFAKAGLYRAADRLMGGGELTVQDFSLPHVWRELVQAYTARKLSVSSDRLRAMAGIAQLFHRGNMGRYVAGLWTMQLETQLLWRRDSRQPILPRPTQYTAPSWSWASIDGAVVANSTSILEDTIKILDVVVEPLSPSTSYTDIKSGFIRLRGRLKLACIDLRTGLLREFSTSENISGFDGEITLDASENWADDVLDCWCLEFRPQDTTSRSSIFGLLLFSLPAPEKYRRIGFFELESKISGMQLDWFDGCEPLDICIV